MQTAADAFVAPPNGGPGEVTWNSWTEDGGTATGAAESIALTPLSSAQAEASIADGVLRVSGWARKPPTSAPDVHCCGTSSASALVRMTDVLHFEATEIGRVVDWELRIDGGLDADYARAAHSYGFTGQPGDQETVWFTGREPTIGGDFVLSAGRTDVPIDLLLSAAVGLGTAESFPAEAGFDLSHTVHFDVHVPDGVHASSDSGQFVFNRAPVPEPAPAAMLAGWRRVRRAAAPR